MIVILDGYTANPGDLSWNALESLGELTIYERTKPDEVIVRAKDADVIQNRAGRWTANPDFCYWDTPLTELAGMKADSWPTVPMC